MSDRKAEFRDCTGAAALELKLWPAVVIPKRDIEAEIERLAQLPAPANGRRMSLIVHPHATEPGLGLAPGIRVTLSVLKPGEQTKPIRHNSTQIDFCIRGGGTAIVRGTRIDFAQYDVWNTPSMAPYRYVNNGTGLQVRLTYSNAALLEKMNVHVVDDDLSSGEATEASAAVKEEEPGGTKVSPFGTFPLTKDGAFLMPYERLINPPAVETKPLHWPWKLVKEQLDKLVALGKDYVGRRLYLLYNPATGRTNGTTPNFFATLTIRPPHIVDRPHRHTSATINYYFAGSGRSTVEGKIYEWQAGDLMLSAPGWGVHNHASYDEPVYELTVQDQPLNIAMESLLWQEQMKLPVVVLGAQTGFETNRSQLAHS
ncbi:MAG: AraC family ligand binding domain-containing protein [Deltaproteobacteria bacterium]|nr:AraC family ligand binding domain-containing protein [Deltaproteobacteria bacterium]